MTEGLDLSGMLAKISENPEASSMLKDLLAGAVPSGNPQMSDTQASGLEDSATQGTPSPRKGYRERCEMLRCLRPYLGPRRCASVDRVLRALELYEILEKTNLMNGGRHV